jgi:hypothetical protein
MYKVGDLVVITSFRMYCRDKPTIKPTCSEHVGYLGKVATITSIAEKHNPWDYIVDRKFWIKEDQVIPAKVVELPIYKALTEVEC